MDSLLIRDRYKVVRVITIRRDYALVEAVDISDRETPNCLLNLYEGEYLHRYVRLCSGLNKEDCPSFRRMYLERGTLITVFDRSYGESIDRVFYRGDRWSIEDRMSWTEIMLHLALSLANYPPEISCAALMSDNILIDLPNKRINIRWMAAPMEDMNQRETALLAADQVRKIFPRSLSAGKAERQFLDYLESGSFRNVVALYGSWRSSESSIREEREAYKKKNIIRRGLIITGNYFRMRKRTGGGT